MIFVIELPQNFEACRNLLHSGERQQSVYLIFSCPSHDLYPLFRHASVSSTYPGAYNRPDPHITALILI